MYFRANVFKWVAAIFLMAVIFSLYACSKQDALLEQGFVGKWKSTRTDIPIYLYANGEWELKSEEGKIQQYGVWQVIGQNIMWSYRDGARIEHDINPVVSITPREFRLREGNNAVTTFTKLE